MKIFITSLALAVLLTGFTTDNDPFVGKILYKFSFSDKDGNDITEKLAPHLGREQHYYINSENYKSHDENGDMGQLFRQETNMYYYFNKGKFVQEFDGATQTSQKHVVTKLNATENIAGYECAAIQIETDDATTIYYYSAKVRTDKNAFANHNFGGWNQYLEATNGALALKHIRTDHKNGFIWTSVAADVSRMDLNADEFALPSDIK